MPKRVLVQWCKMQRCGHCFNDACLKHGVCSTVFLAVLLQWHPVLVLCVPLLIQPT